MSPAVHPHACGEYPGRGSDRYRMYGSSPRLWGIHDEQVAAWVDRRFIPTPVGNTLFSSSRSRQCAVHPHACGEYCVSNGTNSQRTGSSPRLWGIRRDRSVCPSHPRFIPTPVGNTTIT